MKGILFSVMFILSAAFLVKAQESSKKYCTTDVVLNNNYSKASALQSAMDRHTARDLPGLSLAVYSEEEGWWAGASGYAKLETKTPMTICNLQYLQSVSKTYMAVAILQLHEQHKIILDAPITKYLAEKHTRNIKNADQITVRMLLNHTSGIAEYNSHPKYTADVILHPTKILAIEESLQLLKDEPPQFSPGAKYAYTNTNYLLLAIIGDAITGNHATYIAQHSFRPLAMNHSYYRPDLMKMDYAGLPDSYWDILNTGRPANITPMQRANVAPLKGDDGVVSTTTDAVKFLKGLMEGKLLKDSSMKMMKEWVNNDAGKPAYGLGLIHFDLDGVVAYGHGGGGLGAGCVLAYVPSKKLYFFLATNTGVVVDGRGGMKADDAKNELLAILLK
jgi:D-alanyl-D-alanine carboxypeptidase